MSRPVPASSSFLPRGLVRLVAPLLLAGCAATGGASRPAAGADADAGTPPPANALRPYIWTSGMSGDVQAKGVSADVDVSFGDILDTLDMALMLAYEHRFEGGNSLLVDTLYTKLSQDVDVGPLEVDGIMEMAYVELSGAFPIEGSEHVDLILGTRTWYASTEIQIGGFGGDKSVDWVDPLVGLRWVTPLGDEWDLHVRGDVGGFGIGTASELTWQAQVIAATQLGEQTSLGIGYRYLDIDRETGSGTDKKEIDLGLHGLMIGLEYRF